MILNDSEHMVESIIKIAVSKICCCLVAWLVGPSLPLAGRTWLSCQAVSRNRALPRDYGLALCWQLNALIRIQDLNCAMWRTP